MVTQIRNQINGGPIGYQGLSTDDKPTTNDVENGFFFYELDTLDRYLYDKNNNGWNLAGKISLNS